ncbi:MAG: hypothetical protein R3C11_06180 [Planctomycetaceae bacterium]
MDLVLSSTLLLGGLFVSGCTPPAEEVEQTGSTTEVVEPADSDETAMQGPALKPLEEPVEEEAAAEEPVVAEEEKPARPKPAEEEKPAEPAEEACHS